MPSEADATAAGLRVETVSDTAIGERRKGPQQTEVFRRTPRWFRAASWVLQRVAWRARMAEYALPLIEREAISTVRVPWWRRPALWRRGFLGESAVLYDLRGAKAADYLSDRERFLGTRLINGDRAVLLDDKLLFDRLLEPFPELKPRQFGLLDGHRVRPPEDVGRGGEMLDLDGLLEREGKLVVKPSSGGGGKGFLLLEAGPEGGRRVNGQAATADDLAQLGRLSDRLMVMEHVDQHPALEALYPRTTNTLRLLTMLDELGVAAALAVLVISLIGPSQVFGRIVMVMVERWVSYQFVFGLCCFGQGCAQLCLVAVASGAARWLLFVAVALQGASAGVVK